MALFNKNNAAQVQYSERQLLEGSYKNARNNILLILVLTVVNIVLLLTNSNRYFLFSAYIPFFITDWGMYLCGMYPAEYYAVFASPEFLPMGVFVAAMCIVVAILALYVLSWVFSKQKAG